MPTVQLARTVVEIAGPEAEHFLQNIITTDLGLLGEGEARPGALLTPQGKILFDFLVSRAGADRLRLDVRSDVADDFVRRLMLYKLRAMVEISKQEQSLVAAGWETDSASSQTDSTVLRDGRFPEDAGVHRIYARNIAADASVADWDALRIRHAVAESGADYQLGDAFPHDVLLDQNGGVGFRKGCYVGQEVVSRMQHRGTARRRVLIVEGDADLPPAGTQIVAGGKVAGELGTARGRQGLAIARIDRVKDAMDQGIALTAADVPLKLSIPPWASFRFPETTSSAEEA